jgi:hypothetical protein
MQKFASYKSCLNYESSLWWYILGRIYQSSEKFFIKSPVSVEMHRPPLNSGPSYIFNFSKRKFSNVISGESDNQCNQLRPWLDAYWLEYFISGGFISFLFLHSAWNRLQNYVFGQFCDDHPLNTTKRCHHRFSSDGIINNCLILITSGARAKISEKSFWIS